MQFSELIGHTVPMVITTISATDLQEVVIHGVEQGGLWIESAEMTQSLLRGLNAPAGRTPLFFVPFHEIKYAFVGGELALNEKAFGV
jgi:hypothetical protein